MITAAEAYKLSKNNSISGLEKIEKLIKEACQQGKHYITVDESILNLQLLHYLYLLRYNMVSHYNPINETYSVDLSW